MLEDMITGGRTHDELLSRAAKAMPVAAAYTAW